MSWRSIVLKGAALALAGAAGCAGGGAELPWGPLGEALKISYYRVNVDPRSKKLEPTYRVVMSNSWKEIRGESPGEPFARAAPGRVFTGFVTDAQMRAFFRDLVRNGIGLLRASEPESFSPSELFQKALQPAEYEFTRIITIGTDRWHKSFYFRHQQESRELIETFVRCEKLVAQMVQWSILIRSEAVGPPFPKER